MELQQFFQDNPNAAIAFSGGVDSAYLLYAALRWGKRIRAYYVKTAFQPEFEFQDACRLAEELKPSKPMFIEEPCLPENVDCMVNIARSTTVPIASGERLFGKWQYRELLEKQAVSVVQPDLCHCGGIFEGRKIAAMAELYFASVAPHNPLGPISLAACLQLDACIPNFLVQEHPGNPDKSDLGVGYIKEPFVLKNGFIELSNKPGLGVELDEEALQDKIYDGKWTTPRLYYEDGSNADW